MNPPKPTGKPPESINLTGKVFAWRNEQPVLMNVTDSPHLYVACFSTVEQLQSLYERANISYDSIKSITDGDEFLDSFEDTDIKIILNPHYTETGRIRYTQIIARTPFLS